MPRRPSETISELRQFRERVKTSTPREHEVFTLVVNGMLNKQVAFDLETSPKTIRMHRACVMAKMGAESLPDLVRFAEKLDIRSLEHSTATLD